MKKINLAPLLFLVLSCAGSKQFNKASSDNIIERKSIGEYSLSMTRDELDALKNAKVDTIHIYTTYTLPNVKIWYDNKKSRTDQVCACNDYKGEFRNEITVGDYITELSKISEYYWDDDELIYQFKSIKGICFDIPEEQLELDESKKQIDFICIYR